MGAGRRGQTFTNDAAPPIHAINPSLTRNLTKSNLGGVIFGAKNSTIKECLSKQLFGLPAQHFSYVKNIDPGLPLFLFNYSERKLHGIFEAAGSGKMNIDPYAWTSDGSERTLYPAQVQIRVRLQCEALPEQKFKPIIADNYYSFNHFWFELDHAQTCNLMSKFSSLAIAPSYSLPPNTAKWRPRIQGLPLKEKREGHESLRLSVLEDEGADSRDLSDKFVTSDVSPCFSNNNGLHKVTSGNRYEDADEKDLIYMQLRELALNLGRSDAPSTEHVEHTATADVLDRETETSELVKACQEHEKEENESHSSDPSYNFSVISQVLKEVEELKAFKEEYIQKVGSLEWKLVQAEQQIRVLKDKCLVLESVSNSSLPHGDDVVIGSCDEFHLNPNEVIYLVGGYDGISWLSALDSYSPSHDVVKSLKPMKSVRSYASVAKLNGELYVFGGGNGHSWYDTVESYSPVNNKWTSHPSLNKEKGSLAGAALSDKIFAIGGGNGVECFSDVEMYDTNVGRWISTRSMLQKRFALAAVELNDVLYAVGGYDGTDYLTSAERFDPREHSWTRLKGMNTKRGCHSLVVLNEKLYAIGGYDGSAMVQSVEIFDPRLGTWMPTDPMSHPRGYSAAAVLQDTIYVIGGVKSGEAIVDVIECYKEGQGWQATDLKALGRRTFCSAVVLD